LTGILPAPPETAGGGLFDHKKEEYPMKNTLMFLLVSLLLSFSLTACGGDSQQSGTAGQTDGVNGDSAMSGSSAGTNAGGSTGGSVVGGNNGSSGTNGSADDSNGGMSGDGSLVDDARDALDDVGNAVDRAAGDF